MSNFQTLDLSLSIEIEKFVRLSKWTLNECSFFSKVDLEKTFNDIDSQFKDRLSTLYQHRENEDFALISDEIYE